MPMDARKHLIIIKGKDQTDSVANFQFRNGKCEVVYTSAPNKTYSFQSSNVEILPLQKKIDPAQVIVTANGQTISEIDELLDFGGYYRIVRNGKKDLSFRRNEVQFQQNCLADGKNQEAFQYFKETAAAISLVAENGINILSVQYDKIQQVSEDTVLASYLAPQKEVKAPPDAGGGDLSVWPEPEPEAGGGAGAFLQNQHHSGASGYWKDTDDPEYHRQCCPQWKNRGGCLQQQFRNA